MNDFERQKQEAAQRVREINRSYREKAAMPPKPQAVAEKQSRPTKRSVPFDILKLLKLDGIKADPDRLLLIGLFLILNSEEADELLLYALIYIML